MAEDTAVVKSVMAGIREKGPQTMMHERIPTVGVSGLRPATAAAGARGEDPDLAGGSLIDPASAEMDPASAESGRRRGECER